MVVVQFIHSCAETPVFFAKLEQLNLEYEFDPSEELETYEVRSQPSTGYSGEQSWRCEKSVNSISSISLLCHLFRFVRKKAAISLIAPLRISS